MYIPPYNRQLRAFPVLSLSWRKGKYGRRNFSYLRLMAESVFVDEKSWKEASRTSFL